MTEYDFEAAQREWSRLPNDIDYFDAASWLRLTDLGLRRKVMKMERDRYQSWRNFEGKWRRLLGLDSTHGKLILDFGCGAGIEALQFARADNELIVADINESSALLALRVLTVFGYDCARRLIVDRYPFVEVHRLVDVFYSNGVLHHTPRMPEILARAAEILRPDGEVRLLLYSDEGWRVATGTEPPSGDPTREPTYWKFVRFFDSVGLYAEPWWEEKLQEAVRGKLEVVAWDYLCRDGRYAVARLRLPAA